MGQGIILGLCVAFIGLTVDHLIHTWAQQRKKNTRYCLVHKGAVDRLLFFLPRSTAILVLHNNKSSPYEDSSHPHSRR